MDDTLASVSDSGTDPSSAAAAQSSAQGDTRPNSGTATPDTADLLDYAEQTELPPGGLGRAALIPAQGTATPGISNLIDHTRQSKLPLAGQGPAFEVSPAAAAAAAAAAVAATAAGSSAGAGLPPAQEQHDDVCAGAVGLGLTWGGDDDGGGGGAPDMLGAGFSGLVGGVSASIQQQQDSLI